MHVAGRRAFLTFLILSIAVALVASACEGKQGPQGSQGSQGSQGPQGSAGPGGEAGIQGPQGPSGIRGDQGAAGPAGAQGPQGDKGFQGPTGPTLPTKLILVPRGATSAVQPVILKTGDAQPRFIAYGSGFPPGELILMELVSARSELSLRFRSGDKVVTAAGTFKNEWSKPTESGAVPAEPGSYIVRVTTTPSLVQASAPLILEKATQ